LSYPALSGRVWLSTASRALYAPQRPARAAAYRSRDVLAAAGRSSTLGVVRPSLEGCAHCAVRGVDLRAGLVMSIHC
jgi:hypothetical protein